MVVHFSREICEFYFISVIEVPYKEASASILVKFLLTVSDTDGADEHEYTYRIDTVYIFIFTSA